MSKFSLEQLREWWEDFGDIPVDDNGEYIDEDFIIVADNEPFIMWEKGAYKYDIWHWFDCQCPNSLHDDLMYLD